MVKLNKTLIIGFIAFTFLFGPFSATWARRKDMALKFQGQIFSAYLQGVPLRLILEKLEREKGIWFNGADSLFDEKVTVQFTALSLEDGIKRILGPKNYSLIFNRDGELAGVVVIDRVASDVVTGEGRSVRTRRSVSTMPPKNHVNDVGAFEETETLEVTRKSQPSGDPVALTDKDLERFKVLRNTAGPGGPVEVTIEELENFKVIRNAPTPGDPVNVMEEELENFKIVKNCPPPGGPVEVSAEELEKFKVIKNCPPPGN